VFRIFALDELRSQVGQQHGAKRAREEAGQVEDFDMRKGHESPPFCRHFKEVGAIVKEKRF
jgi:hypothetical protein